MQNCKKGIDGGIFVWYNILVIQTLSAMQKISENTMNTKKLDEFIDQMPLRGLPLCDLAISHNGKEIYRRQVGYSDHCGKTPVDNNTLYWIYSNSKVVTCTAAMRLIEESKLSLDDEVSKYLPAFADIHVKKPDGTVKKAENPMKIIHLFTMSGGLDYNYEAPHIKEARNKEGSDTVSICSSMALEPLNFEPGEHYMYSLCHDVLAAVVEVVSGMRFSEYLKKIIFEPLGMENTFFRVSSSDTGRIAEAYMYNNAEGISAPIDSNNGFILSPNYESGGAGLLCTVDDYMKVISALSCDGCAPNGYRILKPETIAMMEENRLPSVPWQDFVGGRLYGYGWGLCGRVHVDPVRSLSLSSVGEFGWDGAHGAFSMVDRKNKLAMYFATQVAGCTYSYTTIHPVLRNLALELIK